ncbi:DUF1254 domain-containing protein [Pseudomonas siliginis]|uniref:DUF1254 domain-containing protein n=1 Tax=Pseudomonas siliginis TaxID=2842346 RepID=UPI002093BD73|nr:DUF1254 domain-containing protein [Pseudomonas siliginis]UST72292.1 DUF1254 domain-containing protein [Pseudomonas siliginis]
MKKIISIASMGLALALPFSSFAQPQLSANDAQEIAREAYIYAYPLVLMKVTKDVSTNVAQPIGLTAPINRLAHSRAFPDPSFTVVVRPNADTLYTALSFDVAKEPLIVDIPDSAGRYYLMPWMDAWTDVFAVPGTRTTGNAAQKFAITGPTWQGKLPDGVTEYRSPTAEGLLIGRVQTNSAADYQAVHGFQNAIHAYPLSAEGTNYVPPKGSVNAAQDKAPPVDQVDKMSASVFFELFAQLMKENPPHANDYPILDRMKMIGIEPGKSFSYAAAPQVIQDALKAAPESALEQIKGAFRKSGTFANGWRTNMTAIGTYGADYLHRAGVAYAALGANVIEDAVYPTAFTDAEGKPLLSDHRYVLRFTKDQIPPVRAFWSLTMYDDHQLFTENPIGRYAIGDRDKLQFGPDGSLEIYIQRESPGKDKETNWLPTPAKGQFSMNLRLYWPEAQALDGRWVPQPVKRVD